MRPWTLPDVRDVLLAVLIWHAGIVGIAWWAGDKTAVNRMRAQAECPGPEPVARREIEYGSGKVRCVYYWRRP